MYVFAVSFLYFTRYVDLCALMWLTRLRCWKFRLRAVCLFACRARCATLCKQHSCLAPVRTSEEIRSSYMGYDRLLGTGTWLLRRSIGPCPVVPCTYFPHLYFCFRSWPDVHLHFSLFYARLYYIACVPVLHQDPGTQYYSLHHPSGLLSIKRSEMEETKTKLPEHARLKPSSLPAD